MDRLSVMSSHLGSVVWGNLVKGGEMRSGVVRGSDFRVVLVEVS